jgi:hypothetical protein
MRNFLEFVNGPGIWSGTTLKSLVTRTTATALMAFSGIAGTAAWAAPAPAPAPSVQARIAKAIPLQADTNGLNGELRLLVDSRLTDLQLLEEADFQLKADPAFAGGAPMAAELQVVDSHGVVRQTEKLSRPIASLHPLVMANGYTLFAVTLDTRAGLDGNNGVTTGFVRVEGANLHWLQAMDEATGAMQNVTVRSTTVADWKVESKGVTRDIYEVFCHGAAQPAGNSLRNTVVDYISFHYDGQRWLKLVKTAQGAWQYDDPFPQSAQFPHPAAAFVQTASQNSASLRMPAEPVRGN